MKKRCKKNIYLVYFLFKTFLANPFNNPVPLVLFVFIVLFYMEGSLDKYHVALIIYLVPLSHYFIGNMFKYAENSENGGPRAHITRYFQALPISGKEIYRSYLASSAIYGMAIYSLLAFLLKELTKFPNVKHTEFIKSVTSQGDTVTTLTGFILSPRGIPRFVSIILNKSLIFDTSSNLNGGPAWITIYYIIVFIYISVFQVFKKMNRNGPPFLTMLLHSVPFAMYLLLGFAFIAELTFSQREMAQLLGLAVRNAEIVLLLFLGAICFTFVSSILMSKSILDRFEKL